MNIQYFSNTLDRTSPGASTKRISIRNSTSTASWVAKTVLLASESTIRSIVNKEGSGTTNS